MKVNIAVCQGLLGTNCNATGSWRYCGTDCYVADANANCLDGAQLRPGAKASCSPGVKGKQAVKQPALKNTTGNENRMAGD
jgi:hypothetical protein